MILEENANFCLNVKYGDTGVCQEEHWKKFAVVLDLY